jgi:hypothetical protein
MNSIRATDNGCSTSRLYLPWPNEFKRSCGLNQVDAMKTFSLRTFFVLLTTLTIWLGSSYRTRLHQQCSANVISLAGGRAIERATSTASWMDADRGFLDKLINPLGKQFFYLELGEYAGSSLQPARLPMNDETFFAILPSVSTIKPQWIGLQGAQLRRDAFDAISKLEFARGISLSDSNICDSDLALFSSMKNLHCLELSNTTISDEGLTQLHSLKLIQINLFNTRVTADGINALKSAIPTLTKVLH